jgi:hypothetical protein
MIILKELLHSIADEAKNGFINIDNWKYTDLDHLINMGFEIGDDFHLNTPSNPKITVYKKKDKDDSTGKEYDYFYVEEPDRKSKRFKTFNDVIDYFDSYEQPELDKNK